MKRITIVWTSIICLGIGFFYCALQKKLIIVQFPSYRSNDSVQEGPVASKKSVIIYYWNQGSFKHESTTIIVSENKADTLRYIVTSWLTILEQTGSLAKRVGLETVMLSSSGNDAYISFERAIFGKNGSTFDKWMCIEGLLKSIRTASAGINSVHFFVHHQPMNDAHLDFSQTWPIHGFM